VGLTNAVRLIAIMLGRLEMDVDECISAYKDLMKAVFEEKLRRVPISWRGNTKAQFDSARLKSAIEKVITSCGLYQADLFNDGTARGCRV
jgi:hypothetical protein